MKKLVSILAVLIALSGCNTVVRCGPGTIAVPDGVDPDGAGFFVNQDGVNYKNSGGKKYKNVTCNTVAPVTICGTNTAQSPPVPGDAINPDGGGFFVNQDGGFFVNQDGTVPAQATCVAVEPI